MGEFPLSLGGLQIRDLDAVLLGDGFLYSLACQVKVTCGEYVVEVLPGELDCYLLVEKGGVAHYPLY